MSKLVDMALGQRIELPSFELNAKPLDSLDVDERLPPILKLAHASHHAQLLATFFLIENPIKFTPTNIMKLQVILEKLDEIYVAKLKWQHQQTSDSFFKST